MKVTNFIIALFMLSTGATADESVPNGLLRMGDGKLFPKYALIVDKSEKKLHIIENSQTRPMVVQSFDSDLGKLSGPKHSTGDKRTPEGVYFFTGIKEANELDYKKYGVRAFVTNYPNLFDEKSGRSGYGIWLHAIDEKETLDRGSRGCVVVRNDTIKKVGQYITLNKTPIIIFDKIQWVPLSQTQNESDRLLAFIHKWKASWEAKNIKDYIASYDQMFTFGNLNLDKYQTYKQSLNEKYNTIKVEFSTPTIYSHKDQIVVKLFQTYRSDQHSDFGEKTLYIKKLPESYGILGEVWEPAQLSDEMQSSLASGQNLFN